MDRTLEGLGLFLCFVLRLGIPIGLTILLAWSLKRLDARWKAEAVATASSEAVRKAAVAQVQCWKLKNCPPERRQGCEAFRRSDVPCWEIGGVNGRFEAVCRDCRVFQRAVALAGV